MFTTELRSVYHLFSSLRNEGASEHWTPQYTMQMPLILVTVSAKGHVRLVITSGTFIRKALKTSLFSEII